MIQMAYYSFATQAFKMDEDKNIQAILQEARAHNAQHHITGQLIYRNGIFVQLLEGEKDKILHLLGRIVLDNMRHTNFKTLFKQELTARVFPNWSMAYKKLDDGAMDLVHSIVPWNELISLSQGNVDISSEQLLLLFKALKE